MVMILVLSFEVWGVGIRGLVLYVLGEGVWTLEVWGWGLKFGVSGSASGV